MQAGAGKSFSLPFPKWNTEREAVFYSSHEAITSAQTVLDHACILGERMERSTEALSSYFSINLYIHL